MQKNLFVYNVIVPLKYFTYDLQSEKKDSEFVMGLKQDIEWDESYFVEEPIPDTNQIFQKKEDVHFHLFCGNDKENEAIPESYFQCRISNLVVHDQEEALAYMKPYLYRICRTLSFLMSKHNCNKQSYQPRVEPDLEHSEWSHETYAPFEKILSRKEDSEETVIIDGKEYRVITVEMASIEISVDSFIKIYGRLTVDDFQRYINCTDLDVNYMLDEFYLALGQENMHSKFFHLFSIIEFVEKRFEDKADATKIFQKDELETIIAYLEDCPALSDKNKRNRVREALKQKLGPMTDFGRNEKLVHILHHMDITQIKHCGTEAEVDKKMIGEITRLRNVFYHGTREEKLDSSYMHVNVAVSILMNICERIIEWVIHHPEGD